MFDILQKVLHQERIWIWLSTLLMWVFTMWGRLCVYHILWWSNGFLMEKHFRGFIIILKSHFCPLWTVPTEFIEGHPVYKFCWHSSQSLVTFYDRHGGGMSILFLSCRGLIIILNIKTSFFFQVLPSTVWRQLRENYNELSCLTKLLDQTLSPIVLLSFANNLYFISLQLFNSLK